MSKPNTTPFRLDADLLSLRALVAIADEGSFSAAAKKIGRTQSAVSLQISKLEERLQTKLLERTSRTVRQTTDGEILTAYARRILDLADEAVMAVSAPEATAPLRVGLPDFLAPRLMNDLLARFKRAHPKVQLELRLGCGDELHRELKQDLLDVVISGPDGDGGKTLLTEPLVWVGPIEYAEKVDEEISLVLIKPPCGYRQATLDALSRSNLAWHLTLEANSVQAVQAAVAAGLGISVMALSSVSENLKILEGDYPQLPEVSMVAYLRTRASHPLAKRFISFLEEGLASLR